MNHPYTLRSILLCGLFLLSFHYARACHAMTLVNSHLTVNTSSVSFDAESDAASCGCGPYFMEVEVVPLSAAFSGAPPAWNSPLWGAAPWYHSLLNVPGYGPPSWADNCALEPYVTVTIPFSALCAGTTFQLRAREIVVGSNSFGPWCYPATFTTPGTPPVTSVSISTLTNSICFGDSTSLTANGSGCTGPYTYSWLPAAGLADPYAAMTNASPSVTTTYTVTFTDMGLGQSDTDTVTVFVHPMPSGSLTSMIESTCNGSNGSATVAASGGTPPYTYMWMPSGGTSATATGLASGAYNVMVMDQNNCMVVVNVPLGDSCDFVWPGDANDDAVANNFDILDIGIANGATGTTRTGATLTWIGQPSTPWGTTLLSGTDYKFVDCNGDGTINASDTTAVILNYGYTHNNRYGADQNTGSAPSLAIVLAQDSMVPGSAGTAQIHLGDAVTGAYNVYGLAFTVNFDPAQIDPNSIGLSLASSWLGTASTDMIGIRHVSGGSVDVAITRLDHVNNSGMGQIGALNFMTTNALTGTGNSVLVPFTISNVRVVTSNGGSVFVYDVNDTLTVYDPAPLGIAQATSLQQFALSPNPADGQFALSFYSAQRSDYHVEIVNALGQIVYATDLKNVEGEFRKEIVLPGNAEGIYLVRVMGANGQASGRVLCR